MCQHPPPLLAHRVGRRRPCNCRRSMSADSAPPPLSQTPSSPPLMMMTRWVHPCPSHDSRSTRDPRISDTTQVGAPRARCRPLHRSPLLINNNDNCRGPLCASCRRAGELVDGLGNHSPWSDISSVSRIPQKFSHHPLALHCSSYLSSCQSVVCAIHQVLEVGSMRIVLIGAMCCTCENEACDLEAANQMLL